MRAGDVPAPLYALAGEAFDVLAAHEEVTNVRGTALFNQRRDSLITGLPSFAEARRVICGQTMVAERFGSEDVAGDRLALQFVYKLFPRGSRQGLSADARRLWARVR